MTTNFPSSNLLPSAAMPLKADSERIELGDAFRLTGRMQGLAAENTIMRYAFADKAIATIVLAILAFMIVLAIWH